MIDFKQTSQDIVTCINKSITQSGQSNDNQDQLNSWDYISDTQLGAFLNTNDLSFLLGNFKEGTLDLRNNGIINFTELDDLDSEQSSCSSPKNLHDQIDVSSCIGLEKQKMIQDGDKSQDKNIIKLNDNAVEKEDQWIKLNGSSNDKSKKGETDNLTYYQRKKNEILRLRQEKVLLDWDEHKRQDELYEHAYVGGASRRRKNRKNDQEQEMEIVEMQQIPHKLHQQYYQSQQQSQGSNCETISFFKEAKSYRRVSRAQRAEQAALSKVLPQEKNVLSKKGKDTQTEVGIVVNEKKSKVDKIEVTLTEVTSSELQARQEDFQLQKLLQEKYVNLNHLYISSRAQAVIPEIRPVEEVKKTWVLKDVSSILAYKPSKEYQKLEDYICKHFKKRQPWEIFSILKLNRYNLKRAIDYCNINADYLKDYFASLDIPPKKNSNNNKRRTGQKS